MRLLPPSNNFIFKALLAKNEILVIDILNAFPEFQGENKITEDFHTTFQLLDKRTGKILLTNTWKCIYLS
jgi:hypothetical protein